MLKVEYGQFLYATRKPEQSHPRRKNGQPFHWKALDFERKSQPLIPAMPSRVVNKVLASVRGKGAAIERTVKPLGVNFQSRIVQHFKDYNFD